MSDPAGPQNGFHLISPSHNIKTISTQVVPALATDSNPSSRHRGSVYPSVENGQAIRSKLWGRSFFCEAAECDLCLLIATLGLSVSLRMIYYGIEQGISRIVDQLAPQTNTTQSSGAITEPLASPTRRRGRRLRIRQKAKQTLERVRSKSASLFSTLSSWINALLKRDMWDTIKALISILVLPAFVFCAVVFGFYKNPKEGKNVLMYFASAWCFGQHREGCQCDWCE